MPLANRLAQLPRVLDAARPAHVLVAAEHDERLEPVMHGLIAVAETELERMFGREERHDVGARGLRPEVGHQVPQVVLFLRADGAVGDHHAHVLARERADRVVGVDPRVDALGRFELGARRPQFDGDDRRVGCAKKVEKGTQGTINSTPRKHDATKSPTDLAEAS